MAFPQCEPRCALSNGQFPISILEIGDSMQGCEKSEWVTSGAGNIFTNCHLFVVACGYMWYIILQVCGPSCQENPKFLKTFIGVCLKIHLNINQPYHRSSHQCRTPHSSSSLPKASVPSSLSFTQKLKKLVKLKKLGQTPDL